jgi:hypothetical protein
MVDPPMLLCDCDHTLSSLNGPILISCFFSLNFLFVLIDYLDYIAQWLTRDAVSLLSLHSLMNKQ